MTLQIDNGDCLELMKKLPDKSVDLFICDLPYGETNCKWDSKIDLDEFWSEFRRLRKSKRTACIHFCSSKFGYTLIKSWEKGFKMDMVWKKRNKTGGLQSRNRPMRNHEMVYFFYDQAPKYNRDKYHKRIVAEKKKEPPNPANVVVSGAIEKDVVEEKDERLNENGLSAHGWNIKHMDKPRVAHFDPKLPVSVLEEKKNPEEVWGWDFKDKEKHLKKYGERGKEGFDPKLPVSVLEEFIEPAEDEPKSMFESTKVFIGKRHHQTQKPDDILEFFLKYWSDEGDTILDPTMGSGSTGVACKKLERNFIGYELDEKIFEVAKKRLD